MSSAVSSSSTTTSAPSWAGLSFGSDDINGAYAIGWIFLILLCLCSCVFYVKVQKYLISEGQATALTKPLSTTRNMKSKAYVEPIMADSEAVSAVYESMDAYFKETTEWGGLGGRVVGPPHSEYHDATTINEKSGLFSNKLVAGPHHKEKALALLTRGVSIWQMLDRKGLFRMGANDLQMDPVKFYNMSRPMPPGAKFKAFVSHTWDAKDFNKDTIQDDRDDHGRMTTKAIMAHIKYKPVIAAVIFTYLFAAAMVRPAHDAQKCPAKSR